MEISSKGGTAVGAEIVGAAVPRVVPSPPVPLAPVVSATPPPTPPHVSELTTEQVVSWLRSACKLNEADCRALADIGLDGSCLDLVEYSDLVTAGVRVLKAKNVLRVLRNGPWPPV